MHGSAKVHMKVITSISEHYKKDSNICENYQMTNLYLLYLKMDRALKHEYVIYQIRS